MREGRKLILLRRGGEEFKKEVVAPSHRFLTDPDGIYPGEFLHIVGVIIVLAVLSLLPDFMVLISRSA